MATFSDNTDAATRDLQRQVEARLMGAGVLLQAEHKRDLSKANPAPHNNPSKPGQYPRARTYNLRDAVAVEKVSPVEIRVGYLKSAWYIVPLSIRARLNIRHTAGRIKTRLDALLRGPRRG